MTLPGRLGVREVSGRTGSPDHFWNCDLLCRPRGKFGHGSATAAMSSGCREGGGDPCGEVMRRGVRMASSVAAWGSVGVPCMG